MHFEKIINESFNQYPKYTYHVCILFSIDEYNLIKERKYWTRLNKDKYKQTKERKATSRYKTY